MDAPKKYIGEPALRANGEQMLHTPTGKPIYDLKIQFEFYMSQYHIDHGIRNDCEACQNALAIREATKTNAYVYASTTVIEYDDICIMGWNSKPMNLVVKIQDHDGKAKPGNYVLNPRPKNQQRGRKRTGAGTDVIMPMTEALKLREKGKLPSSGPALRRMTGWDDHLIESFETMVKETMPPIGSETKLKRVMSPLARRTAVEVD